MHSRRPHPRRRRLRLIVAVLGLASLLFSFLAMSGDDVAASWRATQAADTRTIAAADSLAVNLEAQPEKRSSSRVAESPFSEGSAGVAAATVDGGEQFTMVGVTCDPPAAEAMVCIAVRTSLDGKTWSPWYEGDLEVAADAEAAAPCAFLEATWTGPGRYVQIVATTTDAGSPDALRHVQLVAIDTECRSSLAERALNGMRHLVAAATHVVLAPLAHAAPARPQIVSRSAWGADESLRNGRPDYAAVRMAFVHHTAGGNSYARADAPAIVRGIYAYHTKSLGWNDIGYNFLVDRFGTIYEGRYGGVTKGVIGAQVYGFNTGSTGVSVLGTYSSTVPSAAARASLVELLAWKLSLTGLDPSGTTKMTCRATDKYGEGSAVRLPVIAGHRDANYTACPGDAFYALLPSIRAAVLTVGDPEPWQVSLKLSASAAAVGSEITYSGSVRTVDGRAGSGTVTVQKRRADGGDWIAWRTARLDASGDYAVAVTMTNRQTWEFRARMPGDGGLNQTGYSALAGLTVGGVHGASGSAEYAFTITGRGWGHGIGMSQWGAYGLAKHGKGYKAILKHYYAGVRFRKVKNRTLRVLLRKGLGSVTLTCADAYTVRGAAGSFTIAGGTTATVVRSGSGCAVAAGDFSRVFDGAVTFTPTRRRLEVVTATDLGQTGMHRGRIRIVASGSSLAMVNLVALESYLRAVVPHEVSPSWPAAALRAQVCAARSYAESARRSASGEWDLYCDVRSQAYGGVEWEDRRTDAAVWATTGVVPVHGGDPIQAFYFSCSGGRTESVENVWSTSAIPYLRSVRDPYDSVAPLHTWGPLRRTPAEVADALGGAARGTVRAVCRVRAGASSRIVKAAIVGSEGTTYLHGSTLRTRLGLNSSWATFRSMSVKPSAAQAVAASRGEKVTLSGCIYPALASRGRVTLCYRSGGAWRSRSVRTVRHALKLGRTYTVRYSTYRVVVSPVRTSEYFFKKGVARSPRTSITVK